MAERISRSTLVSALIVATSLALVFLGFQAITGAGGASADAAPRTAGEPATAAHAMRGHVMAVPVPSGDDPDGDGYIPANPPVTGVQPSTEIPPHRYFHEFQANCSVTHTGSVDPIVYPGQLNKSHNHTFMGNDTTDENSTTASLSAGGTACKVPGDLSAYWIPTLYNGDQEVRPVGPQTIYYKAGVTDYTSVRPFPKGLRFVVGNPMQTADEFRNHPGKVEGWECGESYNNFEFPATCPSRPDVQLNLRMQAPSCWDGQHLDTPDHQAHMAYPRAQGANQNVCPPTHPVALPMIEFKMAWPVNGDMSQVNLASGTGHSFHYDFFNAWDEATLDAMVDHCIVGGLQCDARGYDESNPGEGAALDENYELP
ncbi:DUF1996 domain-containing protein [Streptomyces halstedii]|uniref:DUF1996 domain-containing protein n=1 Tax=Streptomyces TaxID=1883 RepID=UPI00048C7FA8|nr:MULTISPECIES: DUF1996 domain-containing protein [Streptomyces]MCW8217085.1 DUF1996 domain-containing protein [Streptomyces griseolus]MYY16283.1 DUF1996 domain-containing protein [Streptomyces sp. SID4912]SCD81318.1 protein of unknown function [Streptomyces sp. DpondAA-D4]SCE07885.1 protein of unknown function [Streptomyces sp. PpalLS-921]